MSACVDLITVEAHRASAPFEVAPCCRNRQIPVSSLDIVEGGFPPSKIYKKGHVGPNQFPKLHLRLSPASMMMHVLSSHRRDAQLPETPTLL